MLRTDAVKTTVIITIKTVSWREKKKSVSMQCNTVVKGEKQFLMLVWAFIEK